MNSVNGRNGWIETIKLTIYAFIHWVKMPQCDLVLEVKPLTSHYK